MELIVFPDALGYAKPVKDKCLGCCTRVRKKSLWGRVKNLVKWDNA